MWKAALQVFLGWPEAKRREYAASLFTNSETTALLGDISKALPLKAAKSFRAFLDDLKAWR